jgi:hypothetical protein
LFFFSSQKIFPLFFYIVKTLYWGQFWILFFPIFFLFKNSHSKNFLLRTILNTFFSHFFSFKNSHSKIKKKYSKLSSVKNFYYIKKIMEFLDFVFFSSQKIFPLFFIYSKNFLLRTILNTFFSQFFLIEKFP